MSTWRDSLRPASWRGITFYVLTSETLAGRRVHLHEYPFRDEPWAEDLGRRSRALSVKGFLIGDDVASQLEDITNAAEEKGSGELTHPIRGTLTVTLLAMAATDAWDEGRVVKLTFEFVETGERRFPGSITDGAGEVKDAATGLDQASSASAETGILSTLKSGYSGALNMVKTAQSYVSTASRLVSSATGALRSVTALAGVAGLGNLGRFIGGSSRGGGFSLGSITSLTGGVSSALSRFNSAQASVTRLGSNIMSLVGRL